MYTLKFFRGSRFVSACEHRATIATPYPAHMMQMSSDLEETLRRTMPDRRGAMQHNYVLYCVGRVRTHVLYSPVINKLGQFLYSVYNK